MSAWVRRAVTGVLAALLVTPVLVVAIPADAGSLPRQKYQRSAFRATNEVRAERDRVELRRGGCLQEIAVRRAQRIAEREELEHQNLQPVLAACRLRLAGENLAAGFATGRKAVEKGWLKSKPHRRNLVERRYRRMGLAARRGEDGRWYVVQLFGRAA